MAFPPKKTPPKAAPKKGGAPAPAPGTPEEEEPDEAIEEPEEGAPAPKGAPKGAPAPGAVPATNQTVPQNGQQAQAAPEFPGVKQPGLGKPPNAAPPSAASMNKAQANAQIPMLSQLMDIVEGLAQLVVSVQSSVPGLSAAPGQAAPSNTTQPATGQSPSNPTQLPPGKPEPMQATANPTPGQPTAEAPKDGQPAPAVPAAHRISIPELGTVIGLIDLTMQGRLPRAGAAVLMSSAFGFGDKEAKALVTPDAGTQQAGQELPPGAIDVDEEGNPIDEDGEPVDEEAAGWGDDDEPEGTFANGEDSEGDGEPVEPETEGEGDEPIEGEEPVEPEKPVFGSKWGFKEKRAKTDAVDTLKALESERTALKIRLDALLEVHNALETD